MGFRLKESEKICELHKTFREIFALTLKRFFIYSFAVHAVILAAILFIIPPAKNKKAGGEFFTDLVSPEELLPKKLRVLPVPKVRQTPPLRPKAAAPAIHGGIHGGKSMPEKETSQSVPKSSPGEIKTGKSGSFPSVSKIAPGGISGETKTEPSRGGNIGKPGNLEPSPDLFDKNIIGALAKRNIEREEKEDKKDKKEKKEKTFTFNAKEYKFLIYNQRLKERIESIWHYPDEAAQKGISGDLIIKFTINKNGRLGPESTIKLRHTI